MRTAIFTLLIFSSSFSNSLFAQAGYYGRRTVVEFGVLGRNPLMTNLEYRNDNFKVFKNENGKLVNKNDKFDFGYSGSIFFLSNRMVSFGLYGSIYKTNSPGLYGSNSYNNNYVDIDAMEKFKYTTYSFIPTISLSANQLVKPVGISSEIGLGYTSAKLVQQDYLYKADPYYKDDVDTLYKNGQLYDRKAKYSAAVLMYGLKMRQPLSKRLLLYYGLRYTVHLGFKDDKNTPSTDYDYKTMHALRRNFINFQAGLCFML